MNKYIIYLHKKYIKIQESLLLLVDFHGSTAFFSILLNIIVCIGKDLVDV